MHSDERPGGLGEIDRRIDAALRSYAEPGEIPEARVVLARVLAEADAESAGRRRLWWWATAATAACLLAALAIGGEWGLQRPRGPEIAWTPRAPSVANHNQEELAEPHGARTKGSKDQEGAASFRVRRARLPEPLPKLDVFPSPRPLTAEEEGLVTFAMQAPPVVKKAVMEDQEQWDKPVIVAELRKTSPNSDDQQDQ